MIELEKTLFALADTLRAEHPDAARAIVATIEPLRVWWQKAQERERERRSAYTRKMMDFYNGSMEDVYAETATEIEQERDRILRVLAVDERWHGSYADLLAVVKR